MSRLIVVSTILGFVAIFVVQSLVFSISNVTIQNKNADCVDNNIENLLNLKGKNILTVAISKQEVSIKKKYLCVDSILLTKKYPHSVFVTIQGRTPALDFSPWLDENAQAAASISGTLQKQYFIATEKGLIFKSMESSPSGVPLIFYSGSRELKVGEDLGSLALNTNSIITKLRELNIPIFEVKLLGNYLEIKSNNPDLIIFNTQGDFSRELASLQLILQTGKMNSDQLPMERVDLRFDKPVINYSPK